MLIEFPLSDGTERAIINTKKITSVYGETDSITIIRCYEDITRVLMPYAQVHKVLNYWESNGIIKAEKYTGD